MRSRLAVLALVLPVGLGTLAGCSGGDEPSATRAAQAGEEISADELTDLMLGALDGATTARLSMQMTAGGQDIDVTGEADYTTDPLSMRMDMNGLNSAGDLSMLMVEGEMFIRLMARSEDWIRVDLDDPSNPVGGSFTGQLDPRAQAEVIAEGLVSATYVGQEDVRGETLDHYAAVVDSAAVLEQLAVGPAGAGALPEELTYDLWFDAEGRYRQLAVDLGAAAGEVLVRFEDWGTDVDIEAPPADEVVDPGSAAG